MGSGCTGTQAADKCFNKVFSNCVKFVGEANETLDICTYDTVTEVIEVLIAKVVSFLDGTGITLAPTLDCVYIENQLSGKEKTLPNIIQVILDSLCDISEDLNDIIDQVNEPPVPEIYDKGCLDVTGDTRQVIIQKLIDELCVLKTQVSNLTDQLLSTGNDLTTLSTTISTSTGNQILASINNTNGGGYGVTKSGAGTNAKIELYGFVPPMTPLPCYAPLENWNPDGSGKINTAFYGYYICNGLNNTPNLFGFGIAQVTSLPGIQTSGIDSRVDPIANSDNDFAAALLDKKGLVKVALTTNELPVHSHTIQDKEHSHVLRFINTRGGDNGTEFAVRDPNPYDNLNITETGMIDKSYTGITGTQSAGAGLKHENRQPTFYAYYIIRY